MKRNKFIKHLNDNNCILHRNGSKHDVFINILTKKKTTVPRHADVDDLLCDTICKQLSIPKP
ncbi:type II toxin-antitoxin system HicA family toxin [Adhaeribacter rhizoryzae]|uniref:Addiction module toxin, HicA family n=1 Tax=Adhaeribacter rhizoryzae TaxID=2607907 RepID=A0A5M6DCN9_9BACT|nr:addiction module toxin, HicA family [Adhaeribacter rhizoryzae]